MSGREEIGEIQLILEEISGRNRLVLAREEKLENKGWNTSDAFHMCGT